MLLYRTLNNNGENPFETNSLIDNQYKIGIHSFYNRKINARLSTKAGLILNQHFFKTKDGKYNHSTNTYRNHIDIISNTQTIQPYAQLKYRISNKASITVFPVIKIFSLDIFSFSKLFFEVSVGAK